MANVRYSISEEVFVICMSKSWVWCQTTSDRLKSLCAQLSIPARSSPPQSVLLGLFPTRFSESVSAANVLQILAVPEKYETMFSTRRCARYAQLIRQFKQLARSETDELVKQLQPAMIEPVLNGSATLLTLYDSLSCRFAHNLPVPSGVKRSDLLSLEKILVRERYEPFARSPDLARVGIGRFLGQLTAQMHTAAAAGEPKLALYSGHDSTVGPLLGCLGLLSKDPHWPTYGANLIFELLEDRLSPKNELFVRVKYNGRTMAIPGCENADPQKRFGGTLCPMSRFLEICSPLIPKDYDQECQINPISS